MATNPIAGGGAGPAIPPKTPPDLLSIQQKYAWDWFSYHAAQRMTSLNYFFVTLGIFAVAYSKCVENKWHGLGCLVGILGAIASIAFWFLDVRNEELVNCGRTALDEIEKELHLTVRCDDHERSHLAESTGWLSGIILRILKIFFPERNKNALKPSGRRKFWAGDVFAHRFWLRILQFGAVAAFAGGAIFAWECYPPIESWRLWIWLHS